MSDNKIKMTIPKEGHQLEPGEYNTEITLSPYSDNSDLGHAIRLTCEIELLQGEKTVLENGDVQYRFNLDEEKGEIFRKAFTDAFWKLKDQKN